MSLLPLFPTRSSVEYGPEHFFHLGGPLRYDDNVNFSEVYPQIKSFCTIKAEGETDFVQQEICHKARYSPTNVNNVLPFKDKHKDHSAILLCTGPTLELFNDLPIDELGRKVVTVGLNGIIFSDYVRRNGLDYLFVQDAKKHISAYREDIYHFNTEGYGNFSCGIQKFYGLYRDAQIKHQKFGPTDDEALAANATQYETMFPFCSEVVPLVEDVGHYTFGGSCSVALAALQFILYTGISRVKLVGCDVTVGVYAGDGQNRTEDASTDPLLLRAWRDIPSFIERYYPTTRVEVVRPVGLIDVFPESNPINRVGVGAHR